MAGIIENVVGGAVFDDFTRILDGYSVRHICYDSEVVRYKYNRELALCL